MSCFLLTGPDRPAPKQKGPLGIGFQEGLCFVQSSTNRKAPLEIAFQGGEYVVQCLAEQYVASPTGFEPVLPA